MDKSIKRINILFQNKNYEIEVNQFHSIHHVINDLYHNIIKKDFYFYEDFYYNYLIQNKDYFLKIIKSEKIKNKENENNNDYLNPNNIIGLYNNYELILTFDIMILLNIITEYISFFIKIILLTNIIIQYILLKLCINYFEYNIDNISFIYYNDLTLKILSICLILFTIMWIILLYIIFIKNKNIQ